MTTALFECPHQLFVLATAARANHGRLVLKAIAERRAKGIVVAVHVLRMATGINHGVIDRACGTGTHGNLGDYLLEMPVVNSYPARGQNAGNGHNEA